MRLPIAIVLLAASTATALAGGAGARASYLSSAGQPPLMFDREPGPDVKFHAFQVIYVNDRTCPPGTIKKITLGNQMLGVRNTRQCVAR